LLAKRLLEVFEAPIELGAESISARLSIGAAKFPQDADTADDLLKAADIALYQAKTEGRGTFTCFDQGMNAALESRRAFERDLRQALAKHEFELHYQPLVSLETQMILGCEALIRWIHPQRGFVSPADFIPLAETTGLIVDIGEWVLRTACAEATHWPNGMKVAVNLSPVQFARPGLVETVSRALSDTGLAPTRLELEITESMLLGDNDAVLRSLEALKSLGIQISMDDFGTGYSSLSYLQKFPFDKIKVDRSFVANLGESEDSVAIIRAVIGLASGLGMTTLAEGVETEHQAGSLLAEGCAQAQGYFFSRPQPAAAIRALLSDLGKIGLRTNEGQARAA
jgi:predicted signal transduction protein with EAL and GGDEF domain